VTSLKPSSRPSLRQLKLLNTSIATTINLTHMLYRLVEISGSNKRLFKQHELWHYQHNNNDTADAQPASINILWVPAAHVWLGGNERVDRAAKSGLKLPLNSTLKTRPTDKTVKHEIQRLAISECQTLYNANLKWPLTIPHYTSNSWHIAKAWYRRN